MVVMQGHHCCGIIVGAVAELDVNKEPLRGVHRGL